MTTELDAYNMFRRGFDTLEIANLMHIPEPEVVKRIDAERKKRDQFKAGYPKAQPKKRNRLIMFNEFGRPVYDFAPIQTQEAAE